MIQIINKKKVSQASLQIEDIEALAAWATEAAQGLLENPDHSVSTGVLSNFCRSIIQREGQREILYRLSLLESK